MLKYEMANRFGAVVTMANGTDNFLDAFYQTERAARNAAIRERARLEAEGKRTKDIRVCTFLVSVTGYSAPIRKGTYPTDFSPMRDRALAPHF